MAKLGGGIDELEVDLLQGPALGLHQQGLGRREMTQESVGQSGQLGGTISQMEFPASELQRQQPTLL